ncbi:6,7-dimethyl-8-ribityllumazine synthase [bacterium]|nr:6,7-dimethyl-8-ribityllumazine synthase [bacterium]
MKCDYDAGEMPKIRGARIALLQAEWYEEYSDLMVKQCTEMLQLAEAEPVICEKLPGTLELPLAARDMKRANPDLEAIILFGIIIRGETEHFQMILDITSKAIERLIFEEDIPVINEIIPAENVDQVIARCSDNSANKGREAAIAAAKVISWRRQLVAGY